MFGSTYDSHTICSREFLKSGESTKAATNAWHLSLSMSIIYVNTMARSVMHIRNTCVHEEAARRATMTVQKALSFYKRRAMPHKKDTKQLQAEAYHHP
jgi:hypothetical protein